MTISSPTHEQIIEAIAKAHYSLSPPAFGPTWEELREEGKISARKDAKYILAAIASLAAIVPREATEEIELSGVNAFEVGRNDLAKAYAAMVETGDLSREKADD